jgi:hypothetical protein
VCAMNFLSIRIAVQPWFRSTGEALASDVESGRKPMPLSSASPREQSLPLIYWWRQRAALIFTRCTPH